MQSAAFCPRRRKAWVTPTVTVLFPSPAAVGLMPVTRTRRPRTGRREMSREIFALYFPYRSRSSPPSPRSAATSVMGRSLACCAIAMSVGTVVTPSPGQVVSSARGYYSPDGRGRQPEESPCVVGDEVADSIDARTARGGELCNRGLDPRRLVALPAVRDRCEVGRVGFGEEP